MKIIHTLEAQLDTQLAAVVCQFVIDPIREPRFHRLEDRIKIVPIDFDQFAIFNSRQRLFGLSRKISEHTEDKRQFLVFNCTANFNVIGDVYSGRANTIDLVLYAFLLRHRRSFLSWSAEELGFYTQPLIFALFFPWFLQGSRKITGSGAASPGNR